MENSPGCLRCGNCCIIRHNGKSKRCKHLVRLKSGKTLCRVFNHRFGTVIGVIDGQSFTCMPRKDVHKNFEGCPFNREEWGETIK